MRIVMMAINDPAGAAIAQANALNRHTGHECRLITKELRYNFMFEKDLHEGWLLPEDVDEVAALLERADVFHFHMTADEDVPFCGLLPGTSCMARSLCTITTGTTTSGAILSGSRKSTTSANGTGCS